MIIAFSGGVGGAKLVEGLSRCLGPGALTAVVNTGDDFDYLGLRICPDLDSVLYALAGLNDEQRGWGRKLETWRFYQTLQQFGLEPWFQLGDTDLATHVLRSDWLRQGQSLTGVTARLAELMGVTVRLVPMSDQAVGTIVETPQGDLSFQDYFVRLRCTPVCCGVRFDGAGAASMSPVLESVLAQKTTRGFIICPSNPIVSIDPILGVPGIREMLERRGVPAVAVSPLIAGEAVKGPAAKMMSELGLEATALGIAKHYQGLLDGIVIDSRDGDQVAAIQALGLKVRVTDTLMNDASARHRVAQVTCDLVASCAVESG